MHTALAAALASFAPLAIALTSLSLGASAAQAQLAPTSTAPSPEERQRPEAQLTPQAGAITITIINRINSTVIVEVIDETGPRRLEGDRTTRLTNLPTPVTVTLNRVDGGLLRVLPRQQGAANALEVFLDAELDLGLDRSALTIETDGSVFLN
ncbi:MAG: hypothetical protein HC824_16340 [Synechococcales cyanobacterium RM1_1_8]|nr:hypothetical protein [Synechococcales cyanobacterium RM1_1_8]